MENTQDETTLPKESEESRLFDIIDGEELNKELTKCKSSNEMKNK